MVALLLVATAPSFGQDDVDDALEGFEDDEPAGDDPLDGFEDEPLGEGSETGDDVSPVGAYQSPNLFTDVVKEPASSTKKWWQVWK